MIHQPKSKGDIEAARKRLAFEEILILQIKALVRKQEWEKNLKSFKLATKQENILELISKLPFSLTPSQNNVLKEILLRILDSQILY